MPTYLFKCHDCTRHTEISLPVDRRDEAPDCPTCKTVMSRNFYPTTARSIPGIFNKVNQNWGEGGQVLYDPKTPEHTPRFRNS